MKTWKRILPAVGIALAAALFLLRPFLGAPRTLDATGPYLGQTPPGARAERFALGLLPRDLHSTPAFSPDGTEVYWKAMAGKGANRLAASRQIDGRWTAPRPVSLGLPFFDSDDPALSADGQTLYFTSWRPKWSRPLHHKERIWQATRQGRRWSDLKPISDAVNGLDLHWQVSVAENGALYFTSQGDLYRAPLADGQHAAPQRLGPAINTQDREGTPFVAPDESYLVFSSNRPDASQGMEDLYVSFHSDGGWSEAVNLGPAVNTAATELCPRVSPDGKYLFFLSSKSGTYDAYWIDAQVIEQLRSTALSF